MIKDDHAGIKKAFDWRVPIIGRPGDAHLWVGPHDVKGSLSGRRLPFIIQHRLPFIIQEVRRSPHDGLAVRYRQANLRPNNSPGGSAALARPVAVREEDRRLPLGVVPEGEVQGVVQAPAFMAALGALDDEVGHLH